MAGTSEPTPPAGPQFAELQAAVLGAALGTRSLPGGQTIQFPDAMFFSRQPESYVLDENLAGALPTESFPIPVRVFSRAELAAAAEQRGELAYWQFRPVVYNGDEIRIGLDGRIVRGDASASALGLSGVDVKFVRQGDAWVAAGPPTYVAA
jgi:hypothetical protein